MSTTGDEELGFEPNEIFYILLLQLEIPNRIKCQDGMIFFRNLRVAVSLDCFICKLRYRWLRYVFQVDDVYLLLDCGWDENFDLLYIEAVKKWAIIDFYGLAIIDF